MSFAENEADDYTMGSMDPYSGPYCGLVNGTEFLGEEEERGEEVKHTENNDHNVVNLNNSLEELPELSDEELQHLLLCDAMRDIQIPDPRLITAMAYFVYYLRQAGRVLEDRRLSKILWISFNSYLERRSYVTNCVYTPPRVELFVPPTTCMLYTCMADAECLWHKLIQRKVKGYAVANNLDSESCTHYDVKEEKEKSTVEDVEGSLDDEVCVDDFEFLKFTGYR